MVGAAGLRVFCSLSEGTT
uniref:Uncharacterized protein n=1 Tax=Anopheles minimus TaxID=112268 RepID=A0A182WN24_9DIPT